MKKQVYRVWGWVNGSDYDAGKPADHSVYPVHAWNEAEADDLGEKRIENAYDKCEVIVSEKV
jgi:hypothetical protein